MPNISAPARARLKPIATGSATNISALPPTAFLRLPQVLALIPVSESTLLRMVRDGRFKKPTKLSERCSAWRMQDVLDFMAALEMVAA